MLPRRSKNLPNIVAMLRIFFRPTTAKEGRVLTPFSDLGKASIIQFGPEMNGIDIDTRLYLDHTYKSGPENIQVCLFWPKPALGGARPEAFSICEALISCVHATL